MRIKFIILLIFFASTTRSQELLSDANTLLLLHFNNSLAGTNGESPINSAGISYSTGKINEALQCSSNTVLRFDTTQNINTGQGTIEFWLKPQAGLVSSSLLDMRTTNGFFIEVGYWTSMYLNTLPANPNPQVSVTAGGNAAYFPGTWYHLAFTWGNGRLTMYLNGKVYQSLFYNFNLYPVPLTSFTIGSSQGGTNQYLGLIDEFRISKVPRTAAEVCNSFMLGMGNYTSIQVLPASISLREGWNVYLSKSTTYQCPQVTAVYPTGNIALSNECISWSVSDTSILQIDHVNKIVKAKNAGSANLTGTINSQNFSIPVQVADNPFPEERVQVIDSFLTNPAACHIKLIPTVAYIYLPTNDGVNIDQTEVGNVPVSIAQIKQNVLQYSKFTKFSLEEGSKFRGHQNAAALPYVGYKVIEYVFVYEPLPRGFPRSANVWFPDYNQVMDRFNGRKLVDSMGVKEVWVWGYHWGQIEPVESNMSSPVTGDISNSNRFPDDMPVYNNTYILYNYNYERGGNEAVHNHGHQFESMIDYICQRQDGNTNLFRQKFRGYPASGGGGPIGRVGDTHHPPNTTSDYDYCNSTLVASDIFDWKPTGGSTTMVNCNSWSSIPYPWPAGISHDANSNWFLLWMQSFPGNGNQVPYNANWMTNWWRFLADWNSVSINTGLYNSNPALNVSLCNPFETQAAGAWDNSATWVGNTVPPSGSKVIIKHAVTVSGKVVVSAIDVQTGGEIQLAPGIKIEVGKDR